MPNKLQTVVRHLRQLAVLSSLTERTDAELLRRYVADGDEAAFGVLARRHSRLIASVCRRVLRREEDVEDAMQATLLVLARKAAAIRKSQALASWLHGVAYRIALNAKKSAARREVHESRAEVRPVEQPVHQAMLHELQEVLDEEVRRLPEKYRAPFTLCYLEGKSKAEAARELGWKEGTVSGRLAEARERLRRSLARRGVDLSAALSAIALSQDAVSASVPAAMIKSVMASAIGKVGGVSLAASTLAEGVLQTMASVKIRWTLALVLASTLTALGAGLTTISLPAAKQVKTQPEESRTEGQTPRTDLYGDPLPPGALARMGTIRYAQGDSIDGYPVLAPDHKTFATVSRQTPYRQGRTVCLWDAATGKERRHLDDADFEPYQAFFLKRENLLGTLGMSRKPIQGDTHAYAMQFWDPKTGKKVSTPLQVLGCHFEPWALSSDEKWLVSASRVPPVVVRERKTGKVLAEWQGNGSQIYRLDFSPDGKTVAIGTENAIHLWEWRANREAGQFSEIPKQSVIRLWFSPGGRWLAAALHGEGLRVWGTKRLTEVRRFAGEYDIRFFPDGKRMLSAKTGVIWDISSGKQVGQLENCANCVALDISADGRSVAGYAMGRMRRWDAETGKDCSPPAPPARRMMIHQVGFLADGKAVVSASPDGAIRLWDAATGRELCTVVEGTVWEPQRSKPIFLRVAADGTIVTAQGKRLSFFKGKGKAEEIALEAEAASLNLSPDGKTLIVAASNRLVQIWDIPSMKDVVQFTAVERTRLEALGVSADRKRVAAYVNRAVALVNASGAVEQILEKRPEQPERRGKLDIFGDGYSYFPGIQAFAFSPKGDMLASSGHLGALKLLDTRSGKTRHVLTPPVPKYHHYELRNVVFSPNGSMIAAESSDGVVDVWETSTGQRRRRFLGHRSYETTLCFSPDGVRLATGNRDGTILIWDVFGILTGTAPDTAPLTEKELPALWARLREGDAEQACRVMGRLMRHLAVSAPFLKQRLLSRKEIETARLRAWIADLDDDNFHKRETASNELAKHLPAAEPLLKERLANKPSLEMRRRLENLLSLVEPYALSQETIRDLRALEVLEQFGAAAIEDVARELAAGNYDPHVAAAAKAARQRLRARAVNGW